MSAPKSPPPGFIFGSFLFRQDIHNEAELTQLWEKKFGPSEKFKHEFCPMKRYYSKEMGGEDKLSRFFIVFHEPQDRSLLKTTKLWAQDIEAGFLSKEGQRQVNLDIGMLTLENLQLATGKNFTHRVYLGDGIFSDLTLIFQRNSFQTLPWTYPDYAHPQIIDFFNQVRKSLHSQINNSY